ncbi:MAG: ABC transporter permease [Sarcina sp.]
MWLAKLKKKKMQYGLLGIIFTVAIALICVSIVVTIVSKTFAERYYAGDDTPDINLITTNKSVLDKSHEWYTEQGNEVRNYKTQDVFSVSTNLKMDEKINEMMMSYIVPMKGIDELSNKVEIIEGDKSQKKPQKGEVWIASVIADLEGIKIGDKIEVSDSVGDTFEYTVSGIVKDSNQPAAAMGILYIYVNESEMLNLSNLAKAYIISMNCKGDSSLLAQSLVEDINEPIGGMVIDKDLYVMVAMMAGSMIGGLSLMAAILLIIAVILILRSNIKNNILKEYKSIGIYKSMGYSSKKIRGIYLRGYLLVSIISSFIGILISIPMINYICREVFKYLGEYNFDGIALVAELGIVLIFNLVIYFNVYLVLREINKIKPVEAINIGVTSSKKKIKKSLIKNNSSSFAMAINDIFKYKKNNIIILIVFILVFYMSTLFLNIASTMVNLDKYFYKIFGTANAELVITTNNINNSMEDIKSKLENDSRVENYYIWETELGNEIGIDNKKYKMNGGIPLATLYNEFNEEDFSISKGRNPRNNKEVSLSISVMRDTKLKIGDYIELKVNGKSKEFLVVGSFASMMNNSQTVRLTTDVIEDSVGNVAFVKLKDIDDYEAIKKDIDTRFKDVVVDKVYAPLTDAASQVVDTSVPISVVFLVGVLVFGIFNIVNILLVNNLDNRKNYGIMKGLGFTSSYIKRRSDYRIMVLATLGGIIGTGIMLLTSKELIKVALGFDVLGISISNIALLVAVIFILIIITMHICNRSINKISTVELISE